MLTPYSSVFESHKNNYHRFMWIGLAREGKIWVWLENDNKPNILITGEKMMLIETLSG